MNAGDIIFVDGAEATVVKVRKTVPVAVVRFEDGHTDLHWYGDEPSAPPAGDRDVQRVSTSDGSAPPSYTPPHKGDGRPETIDMARRWQTRLNKYVNAGLCFHCAGQAAYGHRDGWANVRPPCSLCWPIVIGWDSPTGSPSGWHVLSTARQPAPRAFTALVSS